LASAFGGGAGQEKSLFTDDVFHWVTVTVPAAGQRGQVAVGEYRGHGPAECHRPTAFPSPRQPPDHAAFH
jgi:hypothetical protein